jgi:hypothetical protein
LITVLYYILRKQRFAQNCQMHQNCNPYLQSISVSTMRIFGGTVEWLDKNQIRLCEDILRFWISRFRLVTSVQLDISSPYFVPALQLPTTNYWFVEWLCVGVPLPETVRFNCWVPRISFDEHQKEKKTSSG